MTPRRGSLLCFMAEEKRSANRVPSVLVSNVLETATVLVTGLELTNANPMHVAVVNANGDQVTFPEQTQAAAATVTQVGDSASSVTLAAANTSRLGVSIYNDSTAALYIKCGATAATNSFTVKLEQGDYWEAPADYTGRIDGIWASDAGGNAYVTEFTSS